MKLYQSNTMKKHNERGVLLISLFFILQLCFVPALSYGSMQNAKELTPAKKTVQPEKEAFKPMEIIRSKINQVKTDLSETYKKTINIFWGYWKKTQVVKKIIDLDTTLPLRIPTTQEIEFFQQNFTDYEGDQDDLVGYFKDAASGLHIIPVSLVIAAISSNKGDEHNNFVIKMKNGTIEIPHYKQGAASKMYNELIAMIQAAQKNMEVLSSVESSVIETAKANKIIAEERVGQKIYYKFISKKADEWLQKLFQILDYEEVFFFIINLPAFLPNAEERELAKKIFVDYQEKNQAEPLVTVVVFSNDAIPKEGERFSTRFETYKKYEVPISKINALYCNSESKIITNDLIILKAFSNDRTDQKDKKNKQIFVEIVKNFYKNPDVTHVSTKDLQTLIKENIIIPVYQSGFVRYLPGKNIYPINLQKDIYGIENDFNFPPQKKIYVVDDGLQLPNDVDLTTNEAMLGKNFPVNEPLVHVVVNNGIKRDLYLPFSMVAKAFGKNGAIITENPFEKLVPESSSVQQSRETLKKAYENIKNKKSNFGIGRLSEKEKNDRSKKNIIQQELTQPNKYFSGDYDISGGYKFENEDIKIFEN